jgi:hypothetical protein
MSEISAVLTVGLPFAWWGAILAISGLETPLKFKAPGITVPLGLGIGRLVFRALNAVEIVLAAAVTAGIVSSSRAGPGAWSLLATVVTILLVQTVLLRPALDRRAAALIAGCPPEPSRLHVLYIVGEAVKILALPALGIAMIS